MLRYFGVLTRRFLPFKIQNDPNARDDEAGLPERRAQEPLNEGEGDIKSTASSTLQLLYIHHISKGATL
jgi:hypothetical protein